MGMSFSTAEEKKQVRWFVMRAYKNEKMAEDRLKDKEYGLEYFIPKHYAVRIYHGVKSTRLVPVIPSLVFVHASHSQITEFKKRYNFLQFAMWKKSMGMEYITVPDDQMDSFIQIASLHEKDTVYYKPDEIDIRKGTRVCIHGGKLDGVICHQQHLGGLAQPDVIHMLFERLPGDQTPVPANHLQEPSGSYGFPSVCAAWWKS